MSEETRERDDDRGGARGGQGPEEEEMNRFDVIVRDRVLEFTRDVEEFVKKKEIVSCSFQRNVFYERKEGEFVDRLKEIWTAFVVWKGSVGERSSSSSSGEQSSS